MRSNQNHIDMKLRVTCLSVGSRIVEDVALDDRVLQVRRVNVRRRKVLSFLLVI